MTTEIILPSADAQTAALFTPTARAAERVLEFFTAQIDNEHTRKAYLIATRRFAEWCAAERIARLADVRPIHVAAFVRELQTHMAAPSVKQHLAALRRLFDWLVTGHVLDVNPAHAVRGPKYVVKTGKTSVLTTEEARQLLDSIPIVKKRRSNGQLSEEPSLIGLRDRALIGVMVYTFARINAALEMRVKDYFIQGRRGWVRLHEKGGKEHSVPCHHTLEKYLDEYIAVAGIAGDPEGPLFLTSGRRTGERQQMWQQDAYRMVRRRSVKAGIRTKVGNHTFRATGITAYLKNKGTLETAQHIANHESPRTTKLYDRRHDELSLDEVERIVI